MNYNFDRIINRKETYATKWFTPCEQLQVSDAIPMWVADMDFEVCEEIQQALKKRLECPVFGYTLPQNDLKQLLSDWYKARYNYDFSADSVILTTGVMPSVSAAIRLFSNVNDKVVIPSPSYHPFDAKTLANNRVPLFTKMKFNKNRYVIDFDALEKEIDENCKIFILCNPHNPTGTLYTKEEIEEIAAFCEKHQLKIISDEIHADFVFKGQSINPIMFVNEYTKANTIATLSVSKTFNIAGIKISSVVIANEELRKAFEKEAMCVGITSINLFAFTAFEACYRHGAAWLDQLLNYIDESRTYVEAFMKTELPQVISFKPESTYFFWLDFRNCNIPPEKLEQLLLHEAKVYVSSGESFGSEYYGFVRLNLGCPRSQIEEALKNIKNLVDKYCCLQLNEVK